MDVLLCGLFLALLLMPLLIILRLNQKAEQRLSEVWREIARHTGLAFQPGSAFLSVLGLARPEIRGEYRSRHVSLRRFPTYGYESSWVDIEISIRVKNPAKCLLTIRPKGLLRGKSQPGNLVTGNEQFDRRIVVHGQPREYVQKAVVLIAHSDPRLLASLASSPPTIELTHSQLTCRTSERASVHEYVALLSLLCTIAQIAEEMGTETGV